MTEQTAAAKPQFQDHIGIIHMQAKFGYKWAQGAGVRMDYDDMFQEASLAFLAAADGYDPDTGLKFSTYFTKVAFSHFRQSIGRMTGVKNLNLTQRAEIIERKAENKRRAAAALPPLKDINYGIRPVLFSDISTPGGDFDPFEETLVSNVKTPEQALEFKQAWEAATANLSPLASLIVEWLRDPPPELMRELSRKLAHAEKCETAGVRGYGLRDGLSIGSVTKFMAMVNPDMRPEETALAKSELTHMVKQLEMQE